jgi:hypothetical protein
MREMPQKVIILQGHRGRLTVQQDSQAGCDKGKATPIWIADMAHIEPDLAARWLQFVGREIIIPTRESTL